MDANYLKPYSYTKINFICIGRNWSLVVRYHKHIVPRLNIGSILDIPRPLVGETNLYSQVNKTPNI